MSENKSILEFLKSKTDIDWDRVLKCVEGIMGMIPCSQAVISPINYKSIFKRLRKLLFVQSDF